MCGHIVVHDAGEYSPMDKRSHVMTMTKYGAIHRSKYRFTPLQWSGVLTKHLALCYIVFTFSPDVLSYIGIASRPSMQLPPALLHGVGLFFALKSPPPLQSIPKTKQKEKAQNHSNQRTILSFHMPPTGVEPVLCLQKGILSPSCLPISPQRRNPGLQSPAALWLEREPGITGVRKNYYNHTAIRNLVVLTFLLNQRLL